MQEKLVRLLQPSRPRIPGIAVVSALLLGGACSSSMPEMRQMEEPAPQAQDCKGGGEPLDERCASDTFSLVRHPAPPRPVRSVPAGDDNLLAGVDLGNKRLFCVGVRQDQLCRSLSSAMVRYRSRKVPPLRAFLRNKLPSKRPSTLLYPFSGGDALTAIAAFPHQRRYVLLSLEQGGSPTPIAAMSAIQSRRARRHFLHTSRRMLMNDFSHTIDLQEPEGKRLPGLLPLLLFGLRTHDARVTGMRTFRITVQGTLVYFNRAELARAGRWPRREKGKARYGRLWSDPHYNQPYSHIELRFRLPGDNADRVLHHVAVDLSNPGLKNAPGLDRFLSRLGPHNLMIKAASYLMWKPRYADVRNLILRQARVLVADTSAPPPDHLRSHGLKVQVFGRFSCPMLRSFRRRAGHWRREFRRQKPPLLPFRFGYTDCRRQYHLVLGTRT